MKNITIALPALMLSAAPLLAETNYMSGALSYDRWSIEDFSISETSGAVGYEGTNGKLTYGVDLDITRLSVDGNSLTLTHGAITAGYAFTQNFTVLGSYSRTGFSEGPSDVFETYLVGGEYRLNDYTFGLSASRFSFFGNDTDFVQGFAEYSNGEYMAYASVARSFEVDENVYLLGFERETDRYEASLDYMHIEGFDSVSLSGKYNIRPNMRILAGVNWFDFGPGDITQYELGAGYMVAQDTWFDVGIGRLDFGPDAINQVSLSLTFETGKRRLRTTERSFDPFDLYDGMPLLF
ncbi:hypothetical protein [Aliiroseovarius sp. PrR006]|uniref:hypothetical protein n=1 Tax=Aliiroseovarius sp. PrR006 TaxID=2706883 RepID=UPI0013CF42EC|nr:hypothetical protein [Aliiroseovarius sp. PrR006]NDW52275.1 hypothetical protein [Aliiroseovarius sp. PrR006]